MTDRVELRAIRSDFDVIRSRAGNWTVMVCIKGDASPHPSCSFLPSPALIFSRSSTRRSRLACSRRKKRRRSPVELEEVARIQERATVEVLMALTGNAANAYVS